MNVFVCVSFFMFFLLFPCCYLAYIYDNWEILCCASVGKDANNRHKIIKQYIF